MCVGLVERSFGALGLSMEPTKSPVASRNEPGWTSGSFPAFSSRSVASSRTTACSAAVSGEMSFCSAHRSSCFFRAGVTATVIEMRSVDSDHGAYELNWDVRGTCARPEDWRGCNQPRPVTSCHPGGERNVRAPLPESVLLSPPRPSPAPHYTTKMNGADLRR